MRQITVKDCTSTTLTFVWSSRRAFQAKEGTVIRLSFHIEDEKEKKSDSLMENLPLQIRTLVWHFRTGTCFVYVNIPLNSPWLSSTLRGLDSLDKGKIISQLSHVIYILAYKRAETDDYCLIYSLVYEMNCFFQQSKTQIFSIYSCRKTKKSSKSSH